jgi:anthranilate/para-aminobenzoate synthase component I
MVPICGFFYRESFMPSLAPHTQQPVTGLPLPVDLARELSHLPGFVFLDSSSADSMNPRSDQDRFSLITACPETLLKGNLFAEKDFEKLREVYLRNLADENHSADFGFPNIGLYGTISYEGDFRFGLYRECLVFDHAEENWFELGSLSQRRVVGPPFNVRSSRKLQFESGMSGADFCDKVRTAQDYIAAGDIYQVNLSHRFTAKVGRDFDNFRLYRSLRDRSPAPYSAFICEEDREVLSSSPEQFLSLSGRSIRTRPIKGTRPRFRVREKDEKSAYDLLTSTKEVAELIMITDLERNDLGQICEFGTVEATELLKLERFAQVFHLVSTVEGTLREEVDAVSALRACFPGGSITGAPKKRAREIIEELEPIKRGLYTGAIGCFGFNGESRFNIAIRTAIREGETLHFHVGAGIVADSNPEKEWEETLHKAAGILQAAESMS